MGTHALDECCLTRRGTGDEDKRLGDTVWSPGDSKCSGVGDVDSEDIEGWARVPMAMGEYNEQRKSQVREF